MPPAQNQKIACDGLRLGSPGHGTLPVLLQLQLQRIPFSLPLFFQLARRARAGAGSRSELRFKPLQGGRVLLYPADRGGGRKREHSVRPARLVLRHPVTSPTGFVAARAGGGDLEHLTPG